MTRDQDRGQQSKWFSEEQNRRVGETDSGGESEEDSKEVGPKLTENQHDFLKSFLPEYAVVCSQQRGKRKKFVTETVWPQFKRSKCFIAHPVTIVVRQCPLYHHSALLISFCRPMTANEEILLQPSQNAQRPTWNGSTVDAR